MGYSRQQFYEIRRNYQTYGSEGLLDKLPGCKGPHPNRVAPEIEQAILVFCLDNPTYGPLRVSQELVLQGIAVSTGGVRGVWQRHDLLSKHDRLLRLEKTHREQAIELNDDQIRLLERFSPEFRERQIEVHYTGELVAVDTFFVGTLKGVGKVYLQTVLDCYSRYAWGRLYTRGRLRKRKIKHAKKVTRFSTAFADPSTAEKEERDRKAIVFRSLRRMFSRLSCYPI